jgi:hypothetical protein
MILGLALKFSREHYAPRRILLLIGSLKRRFTVNIATNIQVSDWKALLINQYEEPCSPLEACKF